MAKAPLRRGGTEEGFVDSVAKDGEVVIVQFSNSKGTTVKEVKLSADEGALSIEQDDRVIINYSGDPKEPTVTFYRNGEVVHSKAVPSKNIVQVGIA